MEGIRGRGQARWRGERSEGWRLQGRRRRTSLTDHLQHRLPRLHVGEDFHAVRHLAERGRVVVGVDDQDVDSDRAALLDAV